MSTTQNLVQEECTNCHKIYTADLTYLRKAWISYCPECETKRINAFKKLLGKAE